MITNSTTRPLIPRRIKTKDKPKLLAGATLHIIHFILGQLSILEKTAPRPPFRWSSSARGSWHLIGKKRQEGYQVVQLIAVSQPYDLISAKMISYALWLVMVSQAGRCHGRLWFEKIARQHSDCIDISSTHNVYSSKQYYQATFIAEHTFCFQNLHG